MRSIEESIKKHQSEISKLRQNQLHAPSKDAQEAYGKAIDSELEKLQSCFLERLAAQ